MIAAVRSTQHKLTVQFSSGTSACISNLSNSSFVYSVALGRNSSQPMISYVGEDSITNDSFIGLLTINENCTFELFLYNFTREEHFALSVYPTGQFLFAFFNNSLFILESDSLRSEIWSMNTTLIHYAIDISYEFVVLVGYLDSMTPSAYLIHLSSCDTLSMFNSCMSIIDIFLYNSSTIGNMSVRINDFGFVLWSIGSKLILLNITHGEFQLMNTLNLNNAIRSVAWMGNDQFAVLISSQVLFYFSGLILQSIFPNSWKTLCSTMILNFDSIAWSDVIGLIISDINENVYVIRPTTPGYYSVTNTGCGQNIPFAFSSEIKCPPGSYHFETSLRPCALCPQGTFNSGNYSVQCALCNNSSFCPLGSVANVDGESIQTIVQARAYPKSPDSTIFDDILLQNIFNINFSRHCIAVSAVFWTILVIIITLLLLCLMGASKWFVRFNNIRETIKNVFRQTDLIGEGELWMGGIVSFSVIVLVSFAYAFSARYLNQYPIETASDSSFACNPNLRNAQFSTQMQLIGIPLDDETQTIFNMLDAQPYTLNVDFVNTLFNCQQIIVQQTVGLVVTLISPQNCSYNDAVLSVSVALPAHTIAIQLVLNGTLTVGGIRVGLSGPEAIQGDAYRVQELAFMQSYYVQNRVLSQSSTLELDFIRLINATESLTDGQQTLFSALWVPTFSYVSDQLFLTETQYIGNTKGQTLFTVSLSEKAYYVLNTQSPIAKKAEIVFHSILFTIVCLELFGLFFLIFKLLFLPFFKFILVKFEQLHHSKTHPPTET